MREVSSTLMGWGLFFVLFGMVWFGLVWFGMAWFGLVWYDEGILWIMKWMGWDVKSWS